MLTIIFKTGETQNKNGKKFKSKRKNAKLKSDKLCSQNSDENKKLYSQEIDNTCRVCSVATTKQRVKILYFKPFFKHIVLTSEGDKIRIQTR